MDKQDHLTNIAPRSIFGFLHKHVQNSSLGRISLGLRWKEDSFGMPVCMITDHDKKIHAITYTRTVFASFAQSIAIFTMGVSALPSRVWSSNPPSPICCSSSMSRNAVYSPSSPGEFPSPNTGVFVQRSGPLQASNLGSLRARPVGLDF